MYDQKTNPIDKNWESKYLKTEAFQAPKIDSHNFMKIEMSLVYLIAH